MADIALPIAFAIFVWWFSTGIVLLLDGLPRTTFRWSHLISSALAVGAYVGLLHTAPQSSVAGAYCAFTCALLVWGWHELSFLTGWVTGPRRVPAEPGARGLRRFRQAFDAVLWHELAILASGVLIVAGTWHQPNQVGTQTFAVLWVMRVSAKLNIFLGVRNLSIELLPAHLAYLGSYFRRRPMNRLFPLAVTLATAVAAFVVMQAVNSEPGSARFVGSILVATLLILAIVEHWLLVLPLDATALWRWALRGAERRSARRAAAMPVDLPKPDDTLLHAR